MTTKIHNPYLPIPYPDNQLAKTVLKTPVLLFRLGLEKLVGKFILILSTTGQKTGKTRRTPVEYFEQDGRIYIISGFGSQPDWYQNIMADPHVTIQTDQIKIHAIAREPNTDEEWESISEYLSQSPITKIFLPEYHEEQHNTIDLKQVKKWPALTFDPTDEPCPPPVEADLVWAWPLILLLLALNILVGWLIQRKN